MSNIPDSTPGINAMNKDEFAEHNNVEHSNFE